jgi:AcrR family transcriptional regulator
MHDVIAEAGLSAGAVYRYFPGKEALVREIATAVVAEVVGELDEILASDPLPPLPEVLDALLAAGEKHLEVRLRIAVQVWGEALRNPELAELVRGFYSGFRDRFAVLARRAREAGQLPADSDDDAVAAALFSLLPGYVLQRLLLGDPDRATYLSGVAALFREPV